MALRVWLPLIGDINNKGASIATVAVSGAIVNNNGKLGKTYLFDASDDYISIDSAELRNCFKGGSNPFTIAMWVYNTKTTGSRAVLFGDYGLTGTIQFNVELNSGSNLNDDIRFYWAGSPDYRATGTNVAPNTWIHFAIVYDGTKIDFYRNGTLINTRIGTLSEKEKTSGAYYLGRDSRTGGTAFGGYLNDFRVYDEALSTKEIREISKGLVCHYKLEGVGANPNLAIGTNTNSTSSNVFGMSLATGSTTKTIEKDETGVYCVKIVRDDTAQSGWKYVFYNNFNRTAIKTSTVYTVSLDIKASVDGSMNLTGLVNGNASNYMTDSTTTIQGTIKANRWNHLVFTCVTKSDFSEITIGNQVIYFAPSNSLVGTGVVIWAKNIKLEEGSKETKWIPNETDALYTALGYDKMLLTDVSGNGYNLTKNGTLIFGLGSPRYSGCHIFDTASSYLKLPVLTTSGFANSFTVIYWTKVTDMNGKMAWGFEDGNRLNIFPTGSKICCNTGDSANNPYQNNGTDIDFSQWNNGWHQFAMTADGTSNKLYVDGELQGTAKTYKGMTGTQIYLSGWASSNNYRWTGGSISDFRIYATVLSAADILSLYQVSLALNKKNNLYAYEFTTNKDNLVSLANVAIAQNKMGSYGVNYYNQTNCQTTLTNGCLRVYRTPNIDSSAHNMWGGIRLKPNYNGDILVKGHTYIMLYDAKGQTSNAQGSYGWSNRMDWGGGGLMPAPTNVSYRIIPTNFNSDKWETFWYKWDLTDDVRKVCTSSYGSYVEGETYLSYNDFQVGWGYTSTGELGTDIYVRNFRLYDITDINNPKFLKTGITMSDEINELDDYVKIRKIGYDANSFIEI